MRRPALAVALAFVLTGCATDPVTPASVDIPTAPTPEPAVEMRLLIPAININTPLTGLVLDDRGVVEAPPVTSPHIAGWLTDWVEPGQPGPSLIAGHVSGRPVGSPVSVPGVFARLGQLTPGDLIDVTRDTGSLTFEVYAVDAYAKDSFPTDLVYGPTDLPELRVVTCDGDLIDGSFTDNLIVRARLI